MSLVRLLLCQLLVILAVAAPGVAAETWPPLPETNATVQIPAQEWPLKQGPRTAGVLVHFPGGKRANVNKQTGLMLSLHNWGGSACIGTADPNQLAQRYNVVCLCIDYLQSGPQASIHDPEPYDFGYLQALDALRALSWLERSLVEHGLEFSPQRCYATGGSGGGNVTLMANKLAPRTFACCIDLCGMARLTDDIAFNLPGGSDLNARFVRDPQHPFHLSPDHQELRFVGHPQHAAAMKAAGNECHLIVVHGVDDRTCPIEDAREMVTNLTKAGIDVEPKFVTKDDLDGKVFSSTGHSLGNRTQIVMRVAEQYLLPDSPTAAIRKGKSDFERQEDVVYETSHGKFVISYQTGYPIGKFVAR